jgi:glucose-1-phosphate cytidylyltransferase
VKAVILCGGLGMRLREETEFRPKPMVDIGGKPILWHIMKTYAAFGITEFVLCLGYRGDVIRDYFLNYERRNNDVTVTLGEERCEIHPSNHEERGWRVTLAETGEQAQTGCRVKRIEPYIGEDHFFLTYGDGVARIDLTRLRAFGLTHGRIGTVTGVRPPSRFGELGVGPGDVVEEFEEKPRREDGRLISGGYFMFHRSVFGYLSADEGCVLEHEPLRRLARDGQLMVYRHEDFWHPMDTYRDYHYLNGLWRSGAPPWKVW